MSGVGESRSQDLNWQGLGSSGNPCSSSHVGDSAVVGKHTCGLGLSRPLDNTGHCDTVACLDNGVTHTN